MYVLSSFHDGSLTPGDCNNFHGFYGQLSAVPTITSPINGLYVVVYIIVYDVQNSDSV